MNRRRSLQSLAGGNERRSQAKKETYDFSEGDEYCEGKFGRERDVLF